MRKRLVFFALIFSTAQVSFAAPSDPVRVLLVPSVVQNLNEGFIDVNNMSDALDQITEMFDTQLSLYEQSQCDSYSDQEEGGCMRLKEDLEKTNTILMTTLGEHLPRVEKSLQGTANALKHSLRAEIGDKMTFEQVQKRLLRARSNEQTIRRSPNRRRGGGLADVMEGYWNLVRDPNQSNKNYNTLAAEMYMDTTAALEIIGFMQLDIEENTSRIPDFPGVNKNTLAIVERVKVILHGGEASDPSIPVPLEELETEELYESEWTR